MSRRRPSPARQPSLREHNLALVLGEVAASGPASRARIAAATGLTKATVSTLVDTLVAAGLLRESGGASTEMGAFGTMPARTARQVGRPGTAFSLASGPMGVGLEISVDYLATCTVDLAGDVRRREFVAEDLRGIGVEAALSRAATVLQVALADVVISGADLAGVCVAVPGLVDGRRGLLRLAPNLGWRDVPMLEELAERVGPAWPSGQARLDNEANLAALGEFWAGGHGLPGGAPLESFLHVSGEVGIGAAVVLDGAVFAGTRGFAGEIGHLPLDVGGPLCSCGSRGCLERYAGQEAILRRAGLDAAPRTSVGRPDGPIDELLRRAEAGDRRTREVLTEAGQAIGVGISVAINLVDVDTVLLGGIYARLAPWLVESVEKQLAERVLCAPWDPVRVVVGALGEDAAVRGAATRAVRSVLEDPSGWIADRSSVWPHDGR
jgi:predicted NBD/HSP70 family sugar kinase